MALRNALMAALLEGEASGYDLAKGFDASVANFWAATPQQLYRELDRMAADGLVRARVVHQERRPELHQVLHPPEVHLHRDHAGRHPGRPRAPARPYRRLPRRSLLEPLPHASISFACFLLKVYLFHLENLAWDFTMGRLKSKGVVSPGLYRQRQERVIALPHRRERVPDVHDSANHMQTEATLMYGSGSSAVLRDGSEAGVVLV